MLKVNTAAACHSHAVSRRTTPFPSIPMTLAVPFRVCRAPQLRRWVLSAANPIAAEQMLQPHPHSVPDGADSSRTLYLSLPHPILLPAQDKFPSSSPFKQPLHAPKVRVYKHSLHVYTEYTALWTVLGRSDATHSLCHPLTLPLQVENSIYLSPFVNFICLQWCFFAIGDEQCPGPKYLLYLGKVP